MEISVVADNEARFNALVTGQVDVMLNATPADVDRAADHDLNVLTLDVDVHFLLITDRGGALAPPLADPRVRRAIGHAIDRDAYVAAILEGNGSASGGLVSPTLAEWYDDSLVEVPRFDPDLARALLADAGYPDGFQLTMPTLPLLQTSSEAVAQMLRDVGIRVRLAALQPGQLGPEMRRGSFAATFAEAVQYHPHQLLSTFLAGDGPYNPFGLEDTRQIDEALATAAGADHATAKALYADVQQQAIDGGMMIPVAFAPVVVFARVPVDDAVIPLGARSALPYGVRLEDR
jgi:peptide/nickel transport system substrate-binding protein